MAHAAQGVEKSFDNDYSELLVCVDLFDNQAEWFFASLPNIIVYTSYRRANMGNHEWSIGVRFISSGGKTYIRLETPQQGTENAHMWVYSR